MSAIILLDTSIYLNILNIPGFNQHRSEILPQIASNYQNGDTFILPLASVWETGNHIAHLSNGGNRRTYAQKLVEDVTRAFNGEAPYRATHFPAREEFSLWLKSFPDYAQRNKSHEKPNEGTSLGDFTIIKEWERNCDLHPMTRVRIWSLDQDLSSMDRTV